MTDNPLDKIKGALEFFGSESTLDIIQYTLERDSLDARYFRRDEDESTPVGKFTGSSRKENVFQFNFSNSILEIKIFPGPVVSIEWKREGQSRTVIDYSGNLGPNSGEGIDLIEELDTFRIPLQGVEILLRKDGVLTFRTEQSKVIRIDYPPVFSSDGFKQSTETTDRSRIYGFGEKAFSLNLRGRTFKLWNKDADGKYGSGTDPLYLNIALYLSVSDSSSYMCFYENSSQAVFDVCDSEMNLISGSFISGPAKYYLIFGDLDSIYSNYSRLTGFPHMPPRWSLGYHQSKWSYMDEEEVREISDGFKDNDLPLSAIHLDIDYMDGYRVFTFDRKRFSGIRKLSESLLEQGVRLVTIIDPAIKWDPDFGLFEEGLKNNHFCRTPDGNVLYAPVWPGSAAFPDFTNPETRKWWGSKYSEFLEAGISGFWHDMNEPAAFVIWGDNSLPLSTVHFAGEHAAVHNSYGLFMAQAAHEALTNDKKLERPFLLSRAGWAGQQKYSWIWTGDSESTWEEIRQTVSTILGLSLSGIPYSGSDIGGFSGSPSGELYLRWFQMSSFLPFFRTHYAKGFPAREPWEFGEPYLSIVRRFLKNRYSLVPFIYSEMKRTSTTGEPLIKPLFWLDGNFGLSDTDTEFVMGKNVIVAPVLEPNAEYRTLELPEGKWFDYWNPEKMYDGGSTVNIPVTLETIPVFVRGSSMIPSEKGDIFIISLFVSEKGSFSFEVYNDDSLINGKNRTDAFTVEVEDNLLSVTWSKSGSYEFSYRKVCVRLHGVECAEATIDGKTGMSENGEVVHDGIFDLASFKIKFHS